MSRFLDDTNLFAMTFSPIICYYSVLSAWKIVQTKISCLETVQLKLIVSVYKIECKMVAPKFY